MKRSYVAAATAAEVDDSPDGEVIGRSCSEPGLFPRLFPLLFQQHSASIGLYAARRLGPGPAEDIVAETFLEAYRHRDRYDAARRDARP